MRRVLLSTVLFALPFTPLAAQRHHAAALGSTAFPASAITLGIASRDAANGLRVSRLPARRASADETRFEYKVTFALLGAVVGGVTLGVVTAHRYEPAPCDPICLEKPLRVARNSAIGAAIGALFGSAVGEMIRDRRVSRPR
jgi:hypothetical protein